MNRRHLLPLLLVLALLSTACPQNRIREAAKASDRMATLIGSLIDIKREFGQRDMITPQEELKLTEHLLTINTRVKQFNEFARRQTEDTPAIRLSLAESFNGVTTAINRLSNEAIFPVKNQDARRRLLAILNSLNVTIQIIDTAIRS